MKIAILRKKYTFHGGAETFAQQLIINLADAGHEVHIYAIKWDAGKPLKNIYFHKVPAITFNSLPRDLCFAISSYIMLKREKYDIIQSHDKTFLQDIYRAGDGCHIEWLRQRWKRTDIAGKLSTALNPHHWLVLALERLMLKRHIYKRIMAISETVKTDIIKNYGVSPDDIEVIYNGVDIEKFHPNNRKKYRSEIRKQYDLSENDFVILFVGSGFERKGVKFLIQAVESISDPVSVLIVGRGSARKFAKMTKHQKIVFCGPQRDIERYYAAADVFVFPTVYEPFGNVHLEALASGLPVITTRNSGASEIIEDGVQGFVVQKPEDISTIAEKIQVLLNDRNKLKSMCINARSLAEEFTFEKHIGKTIELYKRVMAGKSN